MFLVKKLFFLTIDDFSSRFRKIGEKTLRNSSKENAVAKPAVKGATEILEMRGGNSKTLEEGSEDGKLLRIQKMNANKFPHCNSKLSIKNS